MIAQWLEMIVQWTGLSIPALLLLAVLIVLLVKD